MTIQSINNNVIDLGKKYNAHFVNNKVHKNTQEVLRNNYQQKQNARADFTSTYYSASKMILHYSNKDGDTISLQVDQIEYQKSLIVQGQTSDSAAWNEIVKNIRDEFDQLHINLLKKLLEDLDGKSPKTQGNAPSIEIDGLPEYWNAENTSQRIVDFATSFYGIAESTGKEYFHLIRSAIEEGFNQAREILGELPDEVSELTKRTYELVMEKLDNWAAQQGIETETGISETDV